MSNFTGVPKNLELIFEDFCTGCELLDLKTIKNKTCVDAFTGEIHVNRCTVSCEHIEACRRMYRMD